MNIKALLEANNFPPNDFRVVFDSSDHVRFQDGAAITGHNYGCHRRFVIEKNIEGHEGYTVTMYNIDGLHPFWGNNIQMAPKRMRIISLHDNIIELRGYGYDEKALANGVPMSDASYANYGIVLLIENEEIKRVQLNMFDRNINIVYLQ